MSGAQGTQGGQGLSEWADQGRLGPACQRLASNRTRYVTSTVVGHGVALHRIASRCIALTAVSTCRQDRYQYQYRYQYTQFYQRIHAAPGIPRIPIQPRDGMDSAIGMLLPVLYCSCTRVAIVVEQTRQLVLPLVPNLSMRIYSST